MHPLLTNPFNTVFAVHCTPTEDGGIHCGGLYVEPGQPFERVRLADATLMLDTDLPPQCVNNQSAVVAWDVVLTPSNS